MDYSVIVFDTAPTGHTLRLLQFPSTLEKGLATVMSLKNKFGGMLTQVYTFNKIICIWSTFSLNVLSRPVNGSDMDRNLLYPNPV